MKQLAKTLFIGVDSADKDLILNWARAGVLPTFRRLLETATWGPTSNPPGLYVGAVWPSFSTSLSPERHGRFCHHQLQPGTYEAAHVKPEDIRGEPFWDVLSRAGKRVAVLDIPKCTPSQGLNGVHVVDWGTHDPELAGFRTWPDRLADEIVARFGVDPYPTCNADRRVGAEFEQFRDMLVDRAERRTSLVTHFLEQGGWDCLLTSFSESHCVGHQCWHIHDASHPRHQRLMASEIGNPIRDVYQSIDARLGNLLEVAGPETTVFVLASHGMGAHFDGTFLLEHIMRRMDVSKPRRELGTVMRSAWRKLPGGIRQRLSPISRGMKTQLSSAGRAFSVPNNDCYGAIRINLAGREPKGRVQPGAEFDAVCEELASSLLELVNVDTGQPAVEQVRRITDFYPSDEFGVLPDLLVYWNRSAPITAVHSEKTGLIQDEYLKCRTGDHRPDGLFFLSAPWAKPGSMDQSVSVMDFGPSIAELLDVELPGVDGKSFLPLVGRR